MTIFLTAPSDTSTASPSEIGIDSTEISGYFNNSTFISKNIAAFDLLHAF